MAIKRNMAKCLVCGDIIESTYRHDFVTCSCGNLSVDGGKDYLKRCFGKGGWEEMSEETSRLKDLFDERSINVKAFAEKSGIKPSTLYAILGGKSKDENIGAVKFKRIADGLGMTMDELYEKVIG